MDPWIKWSNLPDFRNFLTSPAILYILRDWKGKTKRRRDEKIKENNRKDVSLNIQAYHEEATTEPSLVGEQLVISRSWRRKSLTLLKLTEGSWKEQQTRQFVLAKRNRFVFGCAFCTPSREQRWTSCDWKPKNSKTISRVLISIRIPRKCIQSGKGIIRYILTPSRDINVFSWPSHLYIVWIRSTIWTHGHLTHRLSSSHGSHVVM